MSTGLWISSFLPRPAFNRWRVVISFLSFVYPYLCAFINTICFCMGFQPAHHPEPFPPPPPPFFFSFFFFFFGLFLLSFRFYLFCGCSYFLFLFFSFQHPFCGVYVDYVCVAKLGMNDHSGFWGSPYRFYYCCRRVCVVLVPGGTQSIAF